MRIIFKDKIMILHKCYSSSTSVRPRIRFKHKTLQNEAKITIPKHSDLCQTNVNKISSNLLNIAEDKDFSKHNHKECDKIYGIHPVFLALQAQRRSFYKLYYKEDILNKSDKIKEIYRLCEMYNIPSFPVPKNKLNKLVGDESVHQGVCLEASHLPFLVLEDLIKNNKFIEEDQLKEKYKLWLYLDQINDPMNLGAILRTSYYLGVDKVFTSKTNSCPITSVVSKASSGVSEILPVFQVKYGEHFLTSLQKYDWQIIASSLSDKSISIDEFQPTKNILLIIGNEGRGISNELEQISNKFVTIPPHSNCVESVQCLNASVATSILLYSLLSKMKANKI